MACFVPFLLMHPRPAESPVDPYPPDEAATTSSSAAAKLVSATDLEQVIAESSAHTTAAAAILQGPLECSPGGSVDVLGGDSPPESFSPSSGSSPYEPDLVRRIAAVSANSD